MLILCSENTSLALNCPRIQCWDYTKHKTETDTTAVRGCKTYTWTYSRMEKQQLNCITHLEIFLVLFSSYAENVGIQNNPISPNHMSKQVWWYLGGFPSSRLLPSICMCTLTRSAGLATNWPMAPAHSPDKDAFLHKKQKCSNSTSSGFCCGPATSSRVLLYSIQRKTLVSHMNNINKQQRN